MGNKYLETLVLTGCLVSSAWYGSCGRDYYVSPNGDDAAAGTAAMPFRTIHKAVTLARPGDTCIKHTEGVSVEFSVDPKGGKAVRATSADGKLMGKQTWRHVVVEFTTGTRDPAATVTIVKKGAGDAHVDDTGVVPDLFGLQDRAAGAVAAEQGSSAAKLHVYLLIGGAYMAGRAELAQGDGDVIERCHLLDDKGEWVPAREPLNQYSTICDGDVDKQRMGPGSGFVKAMLEADPDISIGLVVNAGGGKQNYIEHWRYKDSVYRAARGRLRKACTTGTLKGVLWHQDANRIDSSLSYLKDTISFFRMDFGELNLPFVAGGLPGSLEHTSRHAALIADVHATGYAKADDLTMGGKYPDALGMQLLGRRYAEEMLRIQDEWREKGKIPAQREWKIIDAHLHGSQNSKDGLDAVVEWMARNGVSRCISKPLTQTRATTPAQREIMLANFRKHRGKVARFCLIEPGEVESVEEAVAILEQEKADEAIGMGEHYGRGLMFDDPKNLLLYEACGRVGLPVHFHIDNNKNMDEKGLPRLERVLKMYPECNLIAHAQFWLQLPDGTCDRLLQQYPNLYAEPSGLRMAAVLNRDRTYTREFLIRNADKILFGTDAGWWSFDGAPGNREIQFELFEELDLPAEVKEKIYHKNAEKLFGIHQEAGESAGARAEAQ